MAPLPKTFTPEQQEVKRLRRKEQNRLAQLRLRQRRRGVVPAEPDVGHVPHATATSPPPSGTTTSPRTTAPVSNTTSSVQPPLSTHPPAPALFEASDPALHGGLPGSSDFLDLLLFPSSEQSTGTAAIASSASTQDVATARPNGIPNDMWAQLMDLPGSAPTPSPTTQVSIEFPSTPIPAVASSSETPQVIPPAENMNLYATLAAGLGASAPGEPQVYESPSDTDIDSNSLLLAQGTQPIIGSSPDASGVFAPSGPISAPIPAPSLAIPVPHDTNSTNSLSESEVHTVARRSDSGSTPPSQQQPLLELLAHINSWDASRLLYGNAYADQGLLPSFDVTVVFDAFGERLGVAKEVMDDDLALSNLAEDFGRWCTIDKPSQRRKLPLNSSLSNYVDDGAVQRQGAQFNWSDLPDEYYPSKLASLVPHHYFIDACFPWAIVRDRIFQGILAGYFSELDLCTEMWGAEGSNPWEGSYRVHGDDLFDPFAYEFSEGFVTRWGFLLTRKFLASTWFVVLSRWLTWP